MYKFSDRFYLGISCFILLIFTQDVTAQMKSIYTTKLKLLEIAANYEQAFFQRYPELAMYWGREDAALDRFMDKSQSALRAWQSEEDRTLTALNALSINDLYVR